MLAAGLTPGRAVAHEVPTDVVIHTILKPGVDGIDFLVRVPLDAMRDVNFPQSGPGYLVISEADATIRDAAVIWIAREVGIFENGEHLEQWEIVAARLSLPSDRSFDSYEHALASFDNPPLPDNTELYRNQALLDVLLRYPIQSETSDFSIEPDFARLGLRTTTVVRFLHPDGVERIFEFSGDPGRVRLDPRWHHAFFRFVQTGIEHIRPDRRDLGVRPAESVDGHGVAAVDRAGDGDPVGRRICREIDTVLSKAGTEPERDSWADVCAEVCRAKQHHGRLYLGAERGKS